MEQNTQGVKPTVSIHVNKTKNVIKDYIKIKVLFRNTLIIQRSHAEVLVFKAANGQQSVCAMWIVFTVLQGISMT